MRTPRLPVVELKPPPANLNGLVRFAERPNLVSARVPLRFKRALNVGVAARDTVWVGGAGSVAGLGALN